MSEQYQWTLWDPGTGAITALMRDRPQPPRDPDEIAELVREGFRFSGRKDEIAAMAADAVRAKLSGSADADVLLNRLRALDGSRTTWRRHEHPRANKRTRG
jgi:hypothetical protein